MHRSSPSQRAWSLAEALVLVLVIAVIAAFLIVVSADNRRRTRLAAGLANLRFFGAGTETYAADNNDRFWNFTWQRGVQYPGFPAVADAYAAAANQAIDIIRRRVPMPDATLISGWVPHISYRHLVLVDYLGLQLPMSQAASPEDKVLLTWQRNAGYNDFYSLRIRPTEGQTLFRWLFSSSYGSGPAFWSRNWTVSINGVIHAAVTQGSQHNQFGVGSVINPSIMQRRLDEVQFPADKAHMWDRYQRHFGPEVLYFAYRDARLPVLMADGSVSVRSTSSANPSFNPAIPSSNAETVTNYFPNTVWEPPTRNGVYQEQVRMYLRFTRGGLRGRDFNGPTVFEP